MITVTLPWPPAALNPNAAKRLHWGKRATLAKRYKRDCGWACAAAGVRSLATSRPLLIGLTFHAPNRQRRDIDNMLASIKAGLDALSTALGVDDSLFDITLSRGNPVAGGSVVVRVSDVQSSTLPDSPSVS
ncbi:hypothetical protein ASE75_06110 [Sphingomonas sp. Leaf17]|uniref:RusA family crossover junction endodeoxyribonuclease n=1 Tax=Sphingomonas sp. Leaf17 TaxID=1735683 RepID=UPI0006F3044C|nr:hypothetical protein [Sphingomonas sp. Leaf17]KQM65802.1 hypothetical protein ASE75_06110 [Sphingomonas sp. Leaf17]